MEGHGGDCGHANLCVIYFVQYDMHRSAVERCPVETPPLKKTIHDTPLPLVIRLISTTQYEAYS